MDTVSFLLNFEGVDVYKEIKEGKPKELMDLSNFLVDHELHDNTRKGELGILKSETPNIPIAEAICLAPKCYSILLDNNNVKNAANGMKRSIITHEKYRDVFDCKIKFINVVNGTILSKHNTMFTNINEKKVHYSAWIKRDIGRIHWRVLHLIILALNEK